MPGWFRRGGGHRHHRLLHRRLVRRAEQVQVHPGSGVGGLFRAGLPPHSGRMAGQDRQGQERRSGVGNVHGQKAVQIIVTHCSTTTQIQLMVMEKILLWLVSLDRCKDIGFVFPQALIA